VNVLAANTQAGTNFGWSVREGDQGSLLPGSTDPILTLPVGSGSALVGGLVYRGPIQSLYGLYFYADYVNKTIKSFRYDSSTGTISDEFDWTPLWLSLFGGVGVTSFGEDNLGNLFLTDLDGGRVFGVTQDLTTPLPAAWLMLLSGLIGFGSLACRGSKRNATA
jgi:hypothetical protein